MCKVEFLNTMQLESLKRQVFRPKFCFANWESGLIWKCVWVLCFEVEFLCCMNLIDVEEPIDPGAPYRGFLKGMIF